MKIPMLAAPTSVRTIRAMTTTTQTTNPRPYGGVRVASTSLS